MPLKIIFCLKYFLPEQIAGTEIYVLSLAKSHLKSGDTIIVLKPNYNITQERQYYYEGICIIEYPESKELNKELLTGFSYPSGIEPFKQILEREKPDLIHFHEISGSNGITVGHIKAAKSLNISVYFTMHLANYSCKTGGLFYKKKYRCNGQINIKRCSVCALNKRGVPKFLDQLIATAGFFLVQQKSKVLRFSGFRSLFNYPSYILQLQNNLIDIFDSCEKVFVLSEWYKKVLLLNDLPSEKIVLLPKVSPLKKTNVLNKIYDTTSVIKLVYVGRITKIKGLHILLKSLSLIKNNKWELSIYGQIDDNNYFLDCQKLINNKSQVHWKGLIYHSDIITSLNEYDLLIFPSEIEEMSPLIIQEAFAAGLPTLSSNVKSIKEIIVHNVNGFLFDVGDANSLRHEISSILSAPQKLSSINLEYKQVSFDDIVFIQKDLYNNKIHAKINE